MSIQQLVADVEELTEYIEALQKIKLPPRQPQEKELDAEQLYALAHEITEAMQKLKKRNA